MFETNTRIEPKIVLNNLTEPNIHMLSIVLLPPCTHRLLRRVQHVEKRLSQRHVADRRPRRHHQGKLRERIREHVWDFPKRHTQTLRRLLLLDAVPTRYSSIPQLLQLRHVGT